MTYFNGCCYIINLILNFSSPFRKQNCDSVQSFRHEHYNQEINYENPSYWSLNSFSWFPFGIQVSSFVSSDIALRNASENFVAPHEYSFLFATVAPWIAVSILFRFWTVDFLDAVAKEAGVPFSFFESAHFQSNTLLVASVDGLGVRNWGKFKGTIFEFFWNWNMHTITMK